MNFSEIRIKMVLFDVLKMKYILLFFLFFRGNEGNSDIWHNTFCLDGFTAWGIVSGSSQSDCCSALQRYDGLHRPLAKGLGADNNRSLVVL